ncbi:MAG TPA: Ig-like domain-containing protein, partial [Pyrinomonadaceae bacterium]|nr:Ig-like domain-containing protein [Pyrinomonadaceae bacterium]
MLFMRARRVVLTLVLVAPLVFVLSPRSKVESTSAPVLPPSITATKAVVDVLGTVDGNADPGDTLEYTITINNGAAPGAGNDATGVAVSDALQNIQTLVGGSLVVSPIAINDTYASIGNVGINVTDGASDLLGNDINPGGGGTLAIVAPVPTTSTQGGQVSINTTTGSFTYNPAPGFEGADTFVYTLGNGSGLTNTATVTINVSGMFWFVQTGAAAGGDGRLGTPFNCFVGTNCFDDTTLDQAADNIFLYTGAYTGGQTLLANQRLIGQGATIALAGPGSITGITIPPFSNTLPSTGGTRPTITTTVAATSAITLGSSNTLRGFNIGDTTAADITGTSFGTLTALEMDLNGTGRPLVLTTGTLAVAFDTLTSTSSTVGAAVSLTTVTGTLTAGSATLTGGVGGIGINGMSSGSVTITTVNINGQSGDGINITNLGSPASVSINGGTIGNTDDPAGNAVEVNGSNGNVTIAAALTKTTAAKIVLVTGRTGNTVAFSGNISATGAVDNGIDINNNTAGITNFTGQTQTLTTGANTAVNLFTNGTGSINFVPAAGGNGLDITTTSGLGFRAETGGTVTVQGAGNSITSTTGTPLSIVNATIGSPDVTFHDISKNGAGTGILLSSTAASGNLVVTGDNSAVTDGTNSSGGIIQNATVGISLINTLDPSFTNMHILTTTGSGVDGTDVTGFTFKNGRINSSGTVAVANTSNIAFNDVVSGINNIDGTVTITGTLLTNAAYHGVDILNESGTISNVTISNNTFTASGNDATTKGSGIHIDVNGSASTGAAITTGTVANNTINNFSSGAGIQFQGGNAAFGPAVTVGVPDGDNVGGGANLITITGNVIGNASIVGGIGTNGILAGVTGTGQGNYRITNNGTVAVPIQHFEGIGIAAFGGNRANVSHFISNNVIDATDNIFGSSGMSVGSQVGGNDATQNGTIKASITNNTINGMEGNGILAGCINSFNTGFFRIVGNTVGNPQAGVRPGIRVESGSSQGDTTVFLEISGNTSGGSTGHAGIGLRKQGSVSTTNEFHIEGLSPSPANHAQMETFVSGLNPGSLLGTGNGGGPSRVLSISGENYLSGNVPFALVAPRPKA